MLAMLINRNVLESLAGGAAFRRGEEYFAIGAVGRLHVQENKVSAKVEGTETYQVELWEEDGDLAGNIDQVADSLAELLQPDLAAMLVGLAEHAIEKVENAMEQVDDSNGEIGGIVYRLGELHLKAYTLAKPDPLALAERLFRFETTLPFGLCSFDAATYRTPLGKKGLQRYRELAEAEWQKIKPRVDDKGYDAYRSAIICDRTLLITLAGKLEKDRGDDAINLYRRVIPAIVDETKNSAYEEGVRLVRKIGGLMKAQNRLRAFGDYLTELRLQFKPKRNFIKLLDTVNRDFGPWR